MSQLTLAFLLTLASLFVGVLARDCESPWQPNSSWELSPFYGALCNAPQRERTEFRVSTGLIPPWLEGTILRNVPGQYSFGADEVRHWFDGMGMIHSLSLDSQANSVFSTAQFANTTSFHVMNSTSQYDYTGFGTYPRPGRLGREETFRSYGASDGIVANNDVNIVALGGRFFATTDRAGFIEFDPWTLTTLTPTHDFQFFDNLSASSARGLGLAHGPLDTDSGEYFNYVADATMSVVGKPTTVYVYKINSTAQFHNKSLPWSRETVGVITTTNNTYAHSMGLTDHFVLWIEQRGITVSELDLALGSTIMDAMAESTEASVLRAIERSTGAVHTIPFEKDLGCVFHTGNTFEDSDGSIVYDMVTYPDCNGYESLTIENMLMFPDKVMPNGQFTRCRTTAGLESVFCDVVLPQTYSSFPWYNKNFHKRPYRFAYTTDIARVAAVTNGGWGCTATIQKIDLSKNVSVAIFSLQNFLFTEAIFVPQFPGNCEPSLEDAGALVTLAFNTDTSLTELFALNASDLSTIFTVSFPFAIPLHFHGIFCGPKPDDVSKQQFCLWN